MGDERFDRRALLAAVEGAPPVSAVDVLAAELARMLDATAVSLLIANFSGTAVNRMSHISRAEDLRDERNERVESLSLPGTVTSGCSPVRSSSSSEKTMEPGWPWCR